MWQGRVKRDNPGMARWRRSDQLVIPCEPHTRSSKPCWAIAPGHSQDRNNVGVFMSAEPAGHKLGVAGTGPPIHGEGGHLKVGMLKVD